MNPFLYKLGFSARDRVAIVHADDIGAYQASLPAIEGLFAAGLVSSCSTMVPCPWFPAVAAWARRTPDADIGVHATLNAEFAAYRWDRSARATLRAGCWMMRATCTAPPPRWPTPTRQRWRRSTRRSSTARWQRGSM